MFSALALRLAEVALLYLLPLLATLQGLQGGQPSTLWLLYWPALALLSEVVFPLLAVLPSAGCCFLRLVLGAALLLGLLAQQAKGLALIRDTLTEQARTRTEQARAQFEKICSYM
jgi:hypothetical protein